MARENRKFTILKRERAMSKAQKGKTTASIAAGLCILGAGTAAYLGAIDIPQMIQQQIASFYSWEALAQNMKDLGPLTTLLTASSFAFMVKYAINSIALKKAQEEFIDFNASLETNKLGGENKELGGEEDARAR